MCRGGAHEGVGEDEGPQAKGSTARGSTQSGPVPWHIFLRGEQGAEVRNWQSESLAGGVGLPRTAVQVARCTGVSARSQSKGCCHLSPLPHPSCAQRKG